MSDPLAVFADNEIRVFENLRARSLSTVPEDVVELMDPTMCSEAQDEISKWPGYDPTALYALPGLAAVAEVDEILYKDESTRFGLGSFKALGGAYEVMTLLRQEVSRQLGRTVSHAEIRLHEHAEIVRGITVVSATDGNHGRSVAWGAREFGCRCYIYIHAEVSRGREDAMAALGATVVRVSGNYDDSVRRAAGDAAENGWFVVSDTSYEGYTELPRYVMAGYSLMVSEIVSQLGERGWPTHVFVQGGCGGLAGALCGSFWQMKQSKPRFVIVEPTQAPCLLESAIEGRPMVFEITNESVMAGLSCGEVSLLAWRVLSRGAESFVAIPDALVGPAMKLLAHGVEGDPKVVAGESAVAGLCALLAARQREALSQALSLDSSSRVILLGTEGATDPEIYEAIVGVSADSVAA